MIRDPLRPDWTPTVPNTRWRIRSTDGHPA
jgi:hypothetical protein